MTQKTCSGNSVIGPGVSHHFASNMLYGTSLSFPEIFRFATLMSKVRLTKNEYEEAKKLFLTSCAGCPKFHAYFSRDLNALKHEEMTEDGYCIDCGESKLWQD